MFSSQSSRLIEEIDRILEGGELDEETTENLCELLSPGGNGVGFDVRSVLHLAEHPVVTEAFENNALPGPLRESMAEAVGAVSAMLGEWSGAPLSVQTDRLRRRFEQERKKYEMVRDRLRKVDPDEGARILGRYLDTSPAPMFSEQLAGDFDEMHQRAQNQRGTGRERLTRNEELVELLQFDRPADEETYRQLAARLEETIADIDDPKGTVDRALVEADVDTRIVAGAVSVARGWNEQAHNMLMGVVRGEEHAPQTAAFSAYLAPAVARHVLGRFLVDVLNDGTPTEDLDIGEEKLKRAIVAARTVLPEIGSPLEDLDDQIDEEAEETADRVRRAWEFCTTQYGEPSER